MTIIHKDVIFWSIIVFFLTLLITKWRRKTDYKNPSKNNEAVGSTVSIMGKSKVGKTTLFTRLIHEKVIETIKTVAEIYDELRKDEGNVLLYDGPGDDSALFGQNSIRFNSKKIIYIISLKNDPKDTEKYDVLYHIYKHVIGVNGTLLIIFNRQEDTEYRNEQILIRDYLENIIDSFKKNFNTDMKTFEINSKDKDLIDIAKEKSLIETLDANISRMTSDKLNFDGKTVISVVVLSILKDDLTSVITWIYSK